MYYTYILISLRDKNFYIGITEDLKRRIEQHHHGLVRLTLPRIPLKLICYEAYLTRQEARKREKYLKSSDGRKELKIRLKDSLNNFLGGVA